MILALQQQNGRGFGGHAVLEFPDPLTPLIRG